MIPIRNRKVSSKQIPDAAFSNDKRFPRSSREKIERASRAIGLTPEAIKSALEAAQMIDLDELERLCREATPGPWDARCRDVRYKSGQRWSVDEFLQWEVEGPATPDGRGEFYESDACLIAALRNAAPELIAMARRYQWLREHTVATGLSQWVHPHQFLDAAIDAAMQEKS